MPEWLHVTGEINSGVQNWGEISSEGEITEIKNM